MKILLEIDSDIIAQDTHLFHNSVYIFRVCRCAVYFTRCRIDCDAQIRWGIAILHWAAKNQYFAVIQLLLARGVNVHAKNEDEDGMTALHFAADQYYARVDTVHALLEAGAEVKEKNKRGLMALQLAMKKQSSDVVKALRAAVKKNEEGATNANKKTRCV